MILYNAGLRLLHCGTLFNSGGIGLEVTSHLHCLGSWAGRLNWTMKHRIAKGLGRGPVQSPHIRGCWRMTEGQWVSMVSGVQARGHSAVTIPGSGPASGLD